MIDGVCLLVAGAFLLTPGLITDTAGFLLLVPALRGRLARWAFEKLRTHGSIHVTTFGRGDAPADDVHRGAPGEGPVIDGEYVRVDGDAERSQPKSDAKRKGKTGRQSPWAN